MSAPAIYGLAQRLATAVHQTRQARHHQTCNCCLYRDNEREGFCTREESIWNAMVDRILNNVTRQE